MHKLVFYSAVTLCFISVVVHILSMAGWNIYDIAPQIWLLHIGIFIIWIPLILFQLLNSKVEWWKTKRQKQFPAGTPRLYQILALVFNYYAIAIFVWFAYSYATKGTPKELQSGYFFNNHGDLTEVLSTEYHKAKSMELAMFSAVWCLFYFRAIATTVVKAGRV